MTDEILLLLAEDELLIQMSVREALEEGGYTVITATRAEEAMALLEARHEDLQGLITDVRLGGGQTGWEIAHRARELRPDLPVIYMTGDSAVEWPANGVPKSLVLQKPFACAQMVTAISGLLNEPHASRPI